MDANKLSALREINYEIRRCCGNCGHSVFMQGCEFGECHAYKYKHLKHNDIRHLSINRGGVCDTHEYTQHFVYSTQQWREFVER